MSVKDVLFDFNKAEIRPDEAAKLKQLADYLKSNEFLVLQINGYTDPRGTDQYNQALSVRRVTAVRKALTDAGVPAERVKIAAFGERQPKCTAQTEPCYQADRRVEIYFGTEEGTAAASPRGTR